MAFFDQSKNSSGAICFRLSSEALALQEMTGTRLGVTCEALALVFIGLVFGLLFNWQLTIIVIIPLVTYGFLILIDIYIGQCLWKKYGSIFERANTVSSMNSSSHDTT